MFERVKPSIQEQDISINSILFSILCQALQPFYITFSTANNLPLQGMTQRHFEEENYYSESPVLEFTDLLSSADILRTSWVVGLSP